MLRLREIVKCRDCRLEIEHDNIPVFLSFEEGDERILPSFYLRFGNGSSTLFKTKYHGDEGGLLEFVMISLDPKHVQLIERTKQKSAEVVQGYPLFEIQDVYNGGRLPEDRILDRLDTGFKVCASKNTAEIILEKPVAVTYCENGPLQFGLDSDSRLCSFRISSLTSSQYKVLEAIATR